MGPEKYLLLPTDSSLLHCYRLKTTTPPPSKKIAMIQNTMIALLLGCTVAHATSEQYRSNWKKGTKIEIKLKTFRPVWRPATIIKVYGPKDCLLDVSYVLDDEPSC